MSKNERFIYKFCNYYIVNTYFIHKMETTQLNEFVITKKVAKHGSQAIIVIPRVLEEELKPHTLVKLTIEVLKKPEEERWQKG